MNRNDQSVLVVDDMPDIRELISIIMAKDGFEVMVAADGKEALELFEQRPPSLIILDIMMPEMDGFELCRRIREKSTVPIIVLSALSEDHEILRAFHEGADDYVVKPFSQQILRARVQAVLRRSALSPDQSPVIQRGPLTIDMDGRSVYLDGRLVHLTRTELSILMLLAQNPGKVISHGQLLREVWGPDYGKENAYLHVYIGRLRRKLEDDSDAPRYIRTEPGIGYRLLA